MRTWLALAVAMAAWGQETPPDVAQGKRIFDAQCALCHGVGGKGGRGPGLARPKLKNAADDAALRKVIEQGIPGTEMPGAWQLHPREAAGVAAYVRSLGTVAPEALPGDPSRGARVYQAQACAACHIVQGKGGGFGPELTEIGARRSAAYLRESLVSPAAAAPDYFLWVEAITADSRKIRGIRLNEDSFTIQLKDAGQAFHSLRKDSLKELRRLFEESPMPSYEKMLSSTELDDLVAYLASLKGKS
ncbi:MAG: c-type cytochrome [Acidobacteria bacterium]|nr:c-type cytochrome [Acidobacteriota bacterium]